jgi:outer membrane protein
VKTLLALVAVVSTLAPTSAFSQTPEAKTPPVVNFKVAYFSLQRAFSDSAEGKSVIARLTTLQVEKSRPLEERDKALQAEQQAFQQSAPLLSEAARTERAAELAKSQIDVRRLFEDLRMELSGLQREAESAFLAKLKPVLEDVIKERDLNLLLNEDAGTIAWADSSLDLTADVVKRLGQPAPKTP